MARKMKDSGIEWIGEIPEGWEITKIKHIVSSVTDLDHFMPDSAEFGIPYLMIGDLKDLSSSIDWDSSKKISIEDYKKLSIKSRPQIGDIIFARYASIGTTCYIDTDRDFLVSYACLTIHPSDLIIGKFLSYYLKSSSFAEDVLRRTNSNTQGNVGKDSLVNATIVLPSIIEQTQIVNFLDAKCSDINAMLSKTRASIEEYKKLKQAVITQAVTKGVRGEREMKDSGVEWIGEIPAEWSICPLKRLAAIQTGCTPSKTSSESFYSSIAGTPWIKPDNLGFSSSIETTAEFLTEEGCSVARTLPSNTVYVGCIGSRIGNCGYSLIPCACNQQINALIFNARMYWKYGWYLTIFQEEQYMLLANGNVIQIINSTTQGNISCIVPSISEQREITAYLDAKCAEIDGLIEKKEQLVKELESYKKSLIYEVVTGKREV